MAVQSIYDKHNKNHICKQLHTVERNGKEEGRRVKKANMKNKEKSKWIVPRKFWSSSL